LVEIVDFALEAKWKDGLKVILGSYTAQLLFTT